MKTIQKTILLLGCVLTVLSATAQQKNTEAELDSLIDLVFTEDEDLYDLLPSEMSYHFIYARLNYNQKTYYAGREIYPAQPNVSPQLMYFNSWGLFAGLSSNWYPESEPQVSSVIASLGYSYELPFAKGVRLRGGYDHFFYTNANNTGTYFGSASAGMSYFSTYFSAQASANILLGGDSPNVSYSVGANGRFELYKFGKRNRIQFKPGIATYIGSEEVEYTKSTNLAGGSLLDTYYYEDKTGLLNVDLRLPVAVTYKNWDVELGMTYKMPQSLDATYSYDKSWNFNFSLGYFFSL